MDSCGISTRVETVYIDQCGRALLDKGDATKAIITEYDENDKLVSITYLEKTE